MNSKIITSLFLLSILFACNNNKPNMDITVDFETIYSFFIDNVVLKAPHGDEFIIAPDLDESLDETYFKELMNFDTIFNEDDLNDFLNQYNDVISQPIVDFLPEKYLQHVSFDRPEENETYYLLSPPLFSKRRKVFILRAKIFFFVNNNLRWNTVTFLLTPDKNNLTCTVYKKGAS